ncbi:MAG: helix-turn-helix transcriptional regulator [Bacteroidaceae bacterium]|nr:helix-turn-helix transcriptional regulator [Bacteroidaceae bacterium]
MFHGTRVSQMYFDYLFFSYRSNTSLDVNDAERALVVSRISSLDAQLKERGRDVNIIESAQILSDILDVCMKAFKRQIDLFCVEPRGLLSMTEFYLFSYFKEGRAARNGLPRVADLARACGLDESYYGTRFHQLTGLYVKEFIQLWMLDTAKNRLTSGWAGLDVISKGLGFSYPNHFSTFFKSMTGMTPSEYRMSRFRQLRLHRTEAGLDL